ncbi:MAG: ABC transporter permease [Thalassobaculales bacterium]
MSVFIAKRFLAFVLTLLGTSIIIFLVMEVLPGDPAAIILGIDATEDAIAALRQKLGLEAPLLLRYVTWIGSAATGDLGISYAYDVPVWELVVDRLAVTLPLALLAMALSVAAALVMGIYAAANHNRAGDVGIMAISQVGIALPSFWVAILLVLLFAVHLGWVSPGGFPGWRAGIGSALAALILPALSLALVLAAILARVTRSAVLEVLREDFIRTARAKGLSRRAVLWRHALRNALIPVVTIMGLQFSGLLAGTIVIENVFSLPGLGRLVFQAISNRDLIVVKSVVLILAVKVVVINFLVDLLYAVIDPRLSARDA